jgi:uncharacterized protein with NRDE domain
VYCWDAPRRYGTRSSAVVLFGTDGGVVFSERTYGTDPHGQLSSGIFSEREYRFRLP